MSTLVAASDADFGWMLGDDRAPESGGLVLPEGGIETPEVLTMLRALAAKLRTTDADAAWMIVASGEVVGLISYVTPPDEASAVEIGFGIAATRRGRGFATRAVADLVALSRTQGRLRTLTAGTAPWNVASQKALSRAGFEQSGTRTDPDDGELLEWRLTLA
jgi:RimJ/RimL family protein N-acetyltransferase